MLVVGDYVGEWRGGLLVVIYIGSEWKYEFQFILTSFFKLIYAILIKKIHYYHFKNRFRNTKIYIYHFGKTATLSSVIPVCPFPGPHCPAASSFPVRMGWAAVWAVLFAHRLDYCHCFPTIHCPTLSIVRWLMSRCCDVSADDRTTMTCRNSNGRQMSLLAKWRDANVLWALLADWLPMTGCWREIYGWLRKLGYLYQSEVKKFKYSKTKRFIVERKNLLKCFLW